MSKTALIDRVVSDTGCSKAEAERQIENTISAIQGLTEKDGQSVVLRGFGTFVRKFRAGREGKNPRTGETIQISAKSVLAFKASK